MEHVYEVVMEWIQGMTASQQTQGAIGAALVLLFLRVMMSVVWGRKAAVALSPLEASLVRRLDNLDIQKIKTNGSILYTDSTSPEKLQFSHRGISDVDGVCPTAYLTRKGNKAIRKKIAEVIVKVEARDKQRVMDKLMPNSAVPVSCIGAGLLTLQETEALRKLIAGQSIDTNSTSVAAKELLKNAIINSGRAWLTLDQLIAKTGLRVEDAKYYLANPMFVSRQSGCSTQYNLKT